MPAIEDSGVVVLGWWVSMFTTRVRIALAEKGISYEYLEEDIPNKSPLLLKHNPIYKKVPVLIHKGKPICESLIIVQYIHETWKEGYPLLPSDPYLKSQAAFWADYIDKHIYQVVKLTWDSKGEEMQKELKNFWVTSRCWKGNSVRSHISMIGNFSVEKDTPKLFAWATQCLKRESVSKTLADPNKIYELLIEIRKKNGLED
ncbi:putative glutathione transferase [Helianthus annuus]|nr:putative glutathione transferase [Helianthus annuus]